MNIDDFLKGLQIEIPEIRFCGVVEKSGHLHAGLYRQGIDEHLKGRNPEIRLYTIGIYYRPSTDVFAGTWEA